MDLLTTLINGFVAFCTTGIPAMGLALLNLFNNIFLNQTTVEGVTTYSGLSSLGTLGVFYLGYRFGKWAIPKVVNMLGRWNAARKARSKKA